MPKIVSEVNIDVTNAITQAPCSNETRITHGKPSIEQTDCGDKKNDEKEKDVKSRYHHKFKESWKSKFPWLRQKSNQAYCQVCHKTINGGKTHIERHAATSVHEKKIAVAERNGEIKKSMDNEEPVQKKLVKSAELKITMFLHEHNLPFLIMDHFGNFLASVCPDSKIAKTLKCARTKSTNLTKDCIAAEQVSNISKSLRDGLFSIIIDETIDISTKKSLAIVARFYDEEQNKCQDKFLGMIKMESCSAEDLFNTIQDYFDQLSIPIINMIGFAADNASVMMECLSEVKARFKQVIPNLFVLGCVCNSFLLCSSAAAHKLPRSLEDMIRGIYKHFSYSNSRQARLVEFQAFVELNPHKLLHPSQTRWLSLQAAVSRVLENWNELILFFTNECSEDNLSSTQNILDQLQAPINKIYFTFLSYVLDIVNRLNVEFQAEKPKLHLLLSRVQGLYRTILRNYMQISYLNSVPLHKIDPRDPKNFIELEDIYFGVQTAALLSKETIDPKEFRNFQTHALEFYMELAEQIKKRFNFDDEVLLFVSKINPVVAVSGEIPNIAIEALKNFPHLVNDVEKLNTEWRLLGDLPELKARQEDSLEDFWTNIFKMKNESKYPLFPHVTKLVKGLLCLPHSSAAAERIFSQLNLMKNDIRHRLNDDTCVSILHAKEFLGDKTCYNWEPSVSLLNRKPKYESANDEIK